MWSFARSAVRAYKFSFLGSFLIVMLAAALLAANGVLMESGIRGEAPLLTTVAASFAGTAILVVVLVVASTFASALRQRHAQFALLRAVGATATQIRSMVTAEVAIVFAIAAPLGAIPGLYAANLLTPVLESGGVVPGEFALTISPLPVVAAIVLLFPTALIAARLAARKVTNVSPTAAVQGASVETSQLSPARQATALCLLVAGILIAGTPFVMPGSLGSAAGATSAFLLISAAALAGPAIIAAVARRASHGTHNSRSAAAVLALINARGFSRRLTAAIIPLALFLALGTVQTGVNGSMVDAAGTQLRAGLESSVIITAPDGVTPEQSAAVASTPGINAVMASSTVLAEVKADEDEDFGDLLWEQTGVRVISGNAAGLFDPKVTAGSLEDLNGAATIAVSSESLFATGKNLGDTIELRFDPATELTATIVAVYERGLGFGSYIMNESSLPVSNRPTSADMLLAQGQADLTSLDLQTVSADDFVDETVSGAASEQQLSAILLFVLIFFVAIAAANTLVMLTSARKGEFALLGRIGTTGGQLRSMVLLESLFVVTASLVIGTLSVVPALFGVSYGMMGSFALAIDWPVYGSLAAAVLVIATLAMMLPASLGHRVRN